MLPRVLASLALSTAFFAFAPSALAAVRSVGPGKTYAKPCAAFAAASDGDTIEIDAAGSYDGDVCAFNKNNLTIRGVGGRAHIDANGKNAGGKAIWVIQGRDTVIEDVELSGCSVPDKNGAGIRQEGRNLTLRRVFLHDNENGILTNADPESSIVIEDSELARNGAGDGQSHNMYIGEIKSFTLRGSYSHHSKVGHLVKSRALRNVIVYNRLTAEDGNGSYEIDLPQGGLSYVIGNVVQQSQSTQNGGMLAFAKEGKRNPGTALFVVNNTFVSTRSTAIFISIASGVDPVTLRNNIFSGAGTVCDQASAIKDGNFVGNPSFVNAAGYDFHLAAGSMAINAGVPAGTGAGQPLAAECQYVHPARAMVRKTVGVTDQGAFEVDGETTTPCGGTVPTEPGDSGVTDSGTSDSGATESDSGVATDSGEPDDAAAIDAAPASAVDGGCGCRTSARGDSRSSIAPFALLGGSLIALRRAARRLPPR